MNAMSWNMEIEVLKYLDREHVVRKWSSSEVMTHAAVKVMQNL
jgi:hypothetical protein